MKVTKKEILEIQSAIESFGSIKLDVHFSYALARNKKILEPEVTALREALKPVDEYINYEKERVDLASRNAAKQNGVPVIRNVGGIQQYVIEDQDKFEKEWDKLKKKYKDAIQEQEERNKQSESILKEEVDISFYMIKFEVFPKEISQDVMTVLLPLIEESEPEVEKK